jgi:sterol desaturase/sphingolipid hydroxylase (fatty acid hydroxylase superfamily)
VIEATYVVLLRHLYDRWLDETLTIRALASWSPAARVTVGVVVGDFVAWFHHWLRHKVPLFWRFHAVHHSQREMNVFTDQRYHPLEYLVTSSVRALPMFMLGASVPTVVGVSLATEMLTKFYHGNVRTNFGPLRYLLVTPQSHRIHHSIELQHRDTNYGVIFSLWDRLFGTQHPSSDVYPETGVEDRLAPCHLQAAGGGGGDVPPRALECSALRRDSRRQGLRLCAERADSHRELRAGGAASP